ncbi:ENTH-domain-containing protein [Obba rivulosa]|uniref:ENTH-domain-containing protein n=1 Tax=Obba rivulosa TaxID=1052685 RepID=A0A8E2ALW4_9APHY|nr:ENTH-domain-containing protein [Obba rivulosa]
MQHIGKGIVRVAKNYTKGYSDVQAKVRDATSNDPWGPSGTQMNEIAQMTFNQNDFIEIMEMLDKRLNDKGKNWRHVFKSLTVLDYLLHAGSENVVIYFRDNLYIIKTLKEFQFIDEEGKDQGANVRQKAKDITNLLQDESRLRQERRSRANMRDRMVRGGAGAPEEEEEGDENARRRSRSGTQRRAQTMPAGDDELRRAIEESKKSLMEEQARQRLTAEERDLQQAIELSKEEEARRATALQESNQSSLFDESNPASNGNNPFPLIDTSVQQSQFMQPQFTQVPAQYTSFNPYQQQAQQEAAQAEYMRQQQEWAQQQQLLQAQQAAQQQAAQQEEWMRQQQLLQFQQQQQQQQQQQLQYGLPAPQGLQPQPTGFGSNNPFAPVSSPPSLSTSSLPSFNASQSPQSSGPVFNLQGTYANSPSMSTSPPPPSQSAPPQQGVPQVRTRVDQEHSHLASLFANRTDDGVDTFGNFGQLRYGQHTGRFVGQQQTGAPQSSYNPFAQQQQQQNAEQPFFSI